MKDYFGVLIDCVTKGSMNVPRMKQFIDAIAKMGYNLLEVCLDDMYPIEGEPYFGYLNGLYKKEELREIERYANERGIEFVPSIQTLGHMGRVLSKPMYLDMCDIGENFLIDDERVDALIEKMFKTMRECFVTDKINLGFDEAHFVGRGRYLDKHGYHDSFDLMLKHLDKVLKIADRYGFKVHIWADMFYKLANRDNDAYISDKPIEFSEDVKSKVPKGIGLCYWDYDSKDERIYDAMLTSLERLDCEPWFAGTIHTFWGYAPMNRYAIDVLKPAMRQVKAHGVKNVLMTLWGHNGLFECSYFSALPGLYVAKQYSEGNYDEAKIKRGFKELFDVDFDDFLVLDILHKNGYNPDYSKGDYTCNVLLHEDCFSGRRDCQLAIIPRIPFGEYKKELEAVAPRMGDFRYLFDNEIALADALEAKAYLGLDTRRAYRENDREELRAMLPRYRTAVEKIEAFRKTFRVVAMRDNTPYGWKYHEERLGGLKSNVADYAERIEAYLDGKCASIPELEDDILPYNIWETYSW